MSESKSTTRRTSLLKLDMLRGAVANAEQLISRGAYRNDKAKLRATYELRDAGKLILALLDDPRINGAMDVGREYVESRGLVFEEYNRKAGRDA